LERGQGERPIHPLQMLQPPIVASSLDILIVIAKP